MPKRLLRRCVVSPTAKLYLFPRGCFEPGEGEKGCAIGWEAGERRGEKDPRKRRQKSPPPPPHLPPPLWRRRRVVYNWDKRRGGERDEEEKLWRTRTGPVQ